MNLTQFIKVYSPDDLTLPYIKDVVCNNPLAENNTRLDPIPISCQVTLSDTGSGPAYFSAAFSDPTQTNIVFIAADATQTGQKKANGDVDLLTTSGKTL